MPGIVRKEQLVSANSLMMGIFPLSMALAFILGGWLLVVSTHNFIITLMLGFNVLATVAYILIREPHERAMVETETSAADFANSIRNGWGI